METLRGNRISSKTAIGQIRIRTERPIRVQPVPVTDTQTEIARYEAAVRQAAAELRALSERASRTIGPWNAKIFEVHAMMAEDVDYRSIVLETIEEKKLCAEYAVELAGRHFAEMFEQMDDPYFRARMQDIKDVTDRLLRALMGEHVSGEPDKPYILAASELAPADLMQQDRSRILGIVTEQGTAYSHASILAKSMRIPMLTGITINPQWDGHQAILDGSRGTLIVDPDIETVKEYLRLTAADAGRDDGQTDEPADPALTKSGKHIVLRANIGDASELEAASLAGAEGIGLLRSEYLFMESAQLPDEEDQFRYYKDFASAMKGQKVVIRTVDIGTDKPVSYLRMPHEENPALGKRAIRLSFDNPDMFRTQLRAIFRAAQFGNVAVLYPMITSEWEMKEIIRMEDEVRKSLLEEGIEVPAVQRGIMIETPSAALISDRLSEYADFFSIGTNDLAQYVLAVDRMNGSVSKYYDPWHDAILRLLTLTVQNAHRKGIPVCLCGELAADPEATARLIALGVDELSVAPSLIPEIRRAIRSCRL
ncbi:MAG: phosphoenolpyruvate--protein phosphotransferase [Lachnospiraceae bacterium]|nr:phosphoenolpyruvate--protein phosphotransferase [Lachnospiraceae bacterium]